MLTTIKSKMNQSLSLSKYSFGMGDQFAHQVRATARRPDGVHTAVFSGGMHSLTIHNSPGLLGDFADQAAEDEAVDRIQDIPVKQAEQPLRFEERCL